MSTQPLHNGVLWSNWRSAMCLHSGLFLATSDIHGQEFCPAWCMGTLLGWGKPWSHPQQSACLLILNDIIHRLICVIFSNTMMVSIDVGKVRYVDYVTLCVGNFCNVLLPRTETFTGQRKHSINCLGATGIRCIDEFHSIYSLWRLEGKGSCDVDIDQSAGSMMM